MATLKHCKALPAYSNYLVWRLLYKTYNLVWDYGFIAIFWTLVSEDTKKRYSFSLIVVNLSSSPILQVEQQKVTVFSLLFNFIHATFCRLYSWLVLSVKKMIYFDLLYLSFPGSLGYIVCQHYKSLFVLPIFDILFNMGARWFCLSCIRRDLISSASRVKR